MMGILEKLNPLVITENMTEYSKPQWNPNNKDIEVKTGNVFFLNKVLFFLLLKSTTLSQSMWKK
jgi:hypothetical protein